MIPGQVRALLYLKLTLLKNAWMRGKRLSFILTLVVGLLVLMAALGLAVGLFALGAFLNDIQAEFHQREPQTFLLLLGDGLVGFLLLAWCGALLAELQRSEVIDFRKMLFLPVPLRLVFLLNFAASLISPALLLFVLPLLGLSLGLSISFGPRMLTVFPLGLTFYFMLAGWTYYVRGLLVFLMENKRRRRTILVVIPMVFAMLGQLPSLVNMMYFSSVRDRASRHDTKGHEEEASPARSHVDWRRVAVAGNALVPLGWFPLGVMKLSGGDYAAPALAFAGLTGLGAGGLAVGYRSTLRYYTGTGRRRRTPPAAPRSGHATRSRVSIMTWRLRWMDDDTAAMTLSSFLGYVRHPQIRLQLVFPIVIGLVMILYFRGVGASGSNPFVHSLAPVGVALWPVLMMVQFIFNVFGIDPHGFQALVLLPTVRSKYLVAKNLALLPITGGIGALFVLLSAFVIAFKPMVLVQALAQVIQIYLIFCILGNFISIYYPYRIRYQGRQPMQSGGASRVLIMLLMLPLVLCVFLLALVPGVVSLSVHFLFNDSLPWLGTGAGVVTSAAFFVLTVLAYLASVRRAGGLLMRREQAILELLVQDRE